MEDIRAMERETKALLDAKVLYLLCRFAFFIFLPEFPLFIQLHCFDNSTQIADSSQQVQNVSTCDTILL